MALRPHNSPLPESSPLRRGFVAFVRRPEADAASALPDETEDDPIGIRMEILRRASVRRGVKVREKPDAPDSGDVASKADTPG